MQNPQNQHRLVFRNKIFACFSCIINWNTIHPFKTKKSLTHTIVQGLKIIFRSGHKEVWASFSSFAKVHRLVMVLVKNAGSITFRSFLLNIRSVQNSIFQCMTFLLFSVLYQRNFLTQNSSTYFSLFLEIASQLSTVELIK